MTTQAETIHFKINGGAILGFLLFLLFGLLVSVYPAATTVVAVALASFAALVWFSRGRIEAWQLMVLVSLTLFVVLNYGFENFTPSVGGVHLLLGEFLMFASIGLVAFGPQRALLFSALREGPMLCMLALLVLAAMHLATDIPRYGLFAARDSAKFIEASFLCLGFFWGSQKRYTPLLLKWLVVLFLFNLIYVGTFPWADQILSSSPKFGVFHPVALIGQYQENAIYLLAGSMFFVWLAGYAVAWPRWLLLTLAVAQFCGLAVLQDRSMYVGVAAVLFLLALIGEGKKAIQFASLLPWALGGLLCVVVLSSAFGVELHGRMGPVTPAFLAEHASTVLALSDDNTRMGADADRAGWYTDIWQRESSSAGRLIFGEGFGQPLVNLENEEGIPVREPHNSTLSVFARLGILGTSIWLLFILLVSARFVRTLRHRARLDEKVFRLTLFLFLYFAVALLNTSVQPTLEFSHGALPFFFLVGVALGVMRWQTGDTQPEFSR